MCSRLYKYWLPVSVVLLVMVTRATAQSADTSAIPPNIPRPEYGPYDTIVVPAKVYGGELLPANTGEYTWVRAPMPPAMRRRFEEWTRLRNAVYVTYPYARRAGMIMNEMNAKMALLGSEKERHQYVLSREKELKSKMLTAMIYPCILFCLALLVLTLLLVFFIPKFQKMFASVHGALPLITQLIIGASHIVRAYGLFIAIGLVGGVVLARTWFASEKGRRVWERLVLRSPLVGPLVAQFAMARFCRMLGTLLGAGVPLVQSLNVARKSIGNQTLVDAVSESIQRVQQGGRLGQSLADCKDLFSGSVLEMISVAEESSKLDAELVRIAAVTESDLDRNLKTAVSFAEPMMLFMIAAFIGTIFVGMLLPVFSLQDYIK